MTNGCQFLQEAGIELVEIPPTIEGSHEMDTKTLSLPRLNGLSPTLESTASN
jgi:hypothetical protein